MADYAIHEETLVDVSNVIRKKDGTSALIDPADYADRINLMGMLEEKTVSGSIAHITDGAYEVPIKSWEVEIAPTLTGKSAIECTQTGKNLLPKLVDGVYEGNGVKAVVVNGIATLSGTTTSTGNAFSIPLTNEFVTPTEQAYIHLCNSAVNASCAPSFEGSSDVTNTSVSASLSPVNRVYSIPSNRRGVVWNRVRFYLGNGVTLSGTFSPMVCYENTASSYEPYTAPTVSTVNLGRTIYGGTADVVKGEGKSTHANVKVSDLTWTKQTASGRDFFISQVSNMKTGTPKEIASVLPYGGEITVAAMADKSLASWTNSLRIYDTDITSVSELLEAYGNDGISYPLATPTTFTFTPITPTPETALGTNNFWADEGDTEVTYRGQGTVYQYPNAEEASF